MVITIVPSFCICFNVDQVFSIHNPVFDGGGEDPRPPFEDITLLGSSGQEERTSSSVENMPHSPEGKCEQCLQSVCYCLKGDFYRDRGWNEKAVLVCSCGWLYALMWSSRWICRGFILGAGAPLGTALQNIGISCGAECSTGLVCGLITYGCGKKYIVLENEEESEVSSSEGGNRGVITAQPQPVESSGVSSSHD